MIPKRFERLTHALEGRCSIQLSYGTYLCAIDVLPVCGCKGSVFLLFCQRFFILFSCFVCKMVCLQRLPVSVLVYDKGSLAAPYPSFHLAIVFCSYARFLLIGLSLTVLSKIHKCLFNGMNGDTSSVECQVSVILHFV